MNTPTCVKESACVYDVSCVCRSCWFFFGFLSSSHLAFLVLVLVRILALALSPQLLQVCLGLLQRILLHLVLHLVSFKCGLDQKNDSCKCCNTNLMRFVRTILGSRNKEKLNFKNNWMNHLKFKNGGENCQNISTVQFSVYAGYIKKKKIFQYKVMFHTMQ